MKIINKYVIFSTVLATAMLGSLVLVPVASAAGPQGSPMFGGESNNGRGEGQIQHPVLTGTVTAVSGNTITVNARMFRNASTTATYTVDASNAVVIKGNATSTVSAIAVNDLIMVQGTLNGTRVTATKIHDRLGESMMEQQRGAMASTSIAGNGEPVIGGNVTAINGTTLTVTTKGSIVYSVNAASTTISKRGVTNATISSITIGDTVIVQGTVQGTSVIASSIIDSGTASTTDPAKSHKVMGAVGRFFGGIFSRVFGFF